MFFLVPPELIPPRTEFRSDRIEIAQVVKAVEAPKPAKVQTKLECTTASLAADGVPIRSIKIAPNWKQTRRVAKWVSGGNSGYDYQFVPKAAEHDAAVSIKWDGCFVEPRHQAAWREILGSEPHKLSEDEKKFLHEALYVYQANPAHFRLRQAQTLVWNGRKVVELQSDSTDVGKPVIENHAVVFDNYGDFKTAGQVSFSGPTEGWSVPQTVDKKFSTMRQ